MHLISKIKFKMVHGVQEIRVPARSKCLSVSRAGVGCVTIDLLLPKDDDVQLELNVMHPAETANDLSDVVKIACLSTGKEFDADEMSLLTLLNATRLWSGTLVHCFVSGASHVEG